LTRALVARRVFADDPVFVVDVGASGGIDGYWTEFAEQFRAVGFDPLVAEVDRLNAGARTGVEYVAAWVTRPDPGTHEAAARSTDFFQRTSAVRAAEITGLDYIREVFNAGAPVERTATRIVLDEYFGPDDRARIDFIKIDTDGGDFDVLRGADAILRNGRVLGLAVEVQFHGPVSDDANLFSNVDRYLRGKGFALFDLEVYRYSRHALPAEFQLDLPAQTVTGQVSWGEAIYSRDLGDPEYESMWDFAPSSVEVLKLACLFEIFGLPDCAAELILKYEETLDRECDRTELLDRLAADQWGPGATFAGVHRRFEDDVRRRFSPHPTTGGGGIEARQANEPHTRGGMLRRAARGLATTLKGSRPSRRRPPDQPGSH
jgi:FkbM family methyltransferase